MKIGWGLALFYKVSINVLIYLYQPAIARLSLKIIVVSL